MAFCFQCGARLPDEASFCPECGADLRAWRAAMLKGTPAAPEAPRDVCVPAPAEAPSAPESTDSGADFPAAPAAPASAEVPDERSFPAEPLYPDVRPVYAQSAWQQAPSPVPAKGMGVAGKILSIVGFASSVVGLLLSFLIMSLVISAQEAAAFWVENGATMVPELISMVAEALILSVVGLVLTRKAASKGNPQTKAGRRFGWIGIVLSAIMAVNVVLLIIASYFSNVSFFI